MPDLAATVVALFGIFIVVACVWGLASPERLFASALGLLNSKVVYWVTIGPRLILGIALLLAAHVSWTPTVFQILAVITLLGAVAIPFIGSSRILQIIRWVQDLPTVLVRVWLVFGLLFGGYLIYAAKLWRESGVNSVL
ncbi:MAG: hypothetical protein ACR2PZ_09560 [Pseudomonadales bacterium]